jgi:hypothetical protein
VLDHLLTPAYGCAPLAIEPLSSAASSFVPQKDATPNEVLAGKINTAEWLKSVGAEDPTPVHAPYEAALAGQAFGSVLGASPTLSPEEKKEHVMALRTPEAVKKVVGMLTAYEWSAIIPRGAVIACGTSGTVIPVITGALGTISTFSPNGPIIANIAVGSSTAFRAVASFRATRSCIANGTVIPHRAVIPRRAT